jgi:hypothetical protein
MADPRTQRNARTPTKTYASGAGSPPGTVLIRQQLVGWDTMAYGIHVIQCDAVYTVDVEGPSGVYAPLPALYAGGVVGGGANAIVIVRGRWPAIRVTTAGNVSVYGDFVLEAYPQ